MRYPIEIPNSLGSLILAHSWDGAVKGLKEWPADKRPPVALPFFAFRLMVGIGFIMLFVAIAGQILQLRGRLWELVWFLRFCPWVAPLGFVAVIAGWIVTEVGSSALDCLWLDAHGRFTLALTHGHGRGAVARFLHRRLSHYVSDRPRFHGRIGTPRAATARSAAIGSRAVCPAVPSRTRRIASDSYRRMRWCSISCRSGPSSSRWPCFITLSSMSFDLGVGILHGFAPGEDARAIVMEPVAPIWNGT